MRGPVRVRVRVREGHVLLESENEIGREYLLNEIGREHLLKTAANALDFAVINTYA